MTFTDIVSDIRVEENFSRGDQIDAHKEVETIDDKAPDTDLRDRVKIDVQYGESRQEILDTLAEFRERSDGSFNRLKMAKPRIELSASDERPIKSALYCTGPNPRELKNPKSTKIICLNIKESKNSEWASPIIFAPKKDDFLRF